MPNSSTCRPSVLFGIILLLFASHSLSALDAELTNYKSGIDVTWGGIKGSDYYEEYFYHDKLMDDHKVVYIRSTTPITMAHNSLNNANYHTISGGRKIIGSNGLDGIPNSGDEGVIRYKIDRDRQYLYKWAKNSAGTNGSSLLPAYSGPFTLASQRFDETTPVVGTTGSNGGSVASKLSYYYRGILDSFGDEWHVLSYADDDEAFLRAYSTASGNNVDQAFYASDGKTVLLVVNPKTPCFTARATGTGQFYTTVPKAYFTPKIVAQTTYISAGDNGTVTIELRDINGNDVYYRINGGAYVNAGTSSKTLPDTIFKSGTNILEYYYQGNEQFVKTRIVIKDPVHPSAAERHGNYLWMDDAGYSTVRSRLTRQPYSGYYNNYKTRGDQSGHTDWDTKAGRGRRDVTGGNALENAFVAKVEGFNYVRSDGSKSHGRYAKEMVLEQSRNIDPLGFELQHSGDAIPNRELHYRGYYDSLPVLKALFAYDILIANFRSNQVAGGITPIEDYFIRDKFAGFAYEAMQWSADMTLLEAPGMWGGARMMCAQSIAMIMPEYSSPYYGTSGFGTVQTTYLLCPYESDRLTWKGALFDGTAKKTSYPNLKWYTGISDNGAESLLLAEDQVWGTNKYPLGTWGDKAAYFSSGLMGIHLSIWANMAKRWGGKTDPRLEIAIQNAAKGTLIGAKDPYPQTPARFTMLLVTNDNWPNVSANILTYIKALPTNNNESDGKAMQDAGVFGFAWYDDQVKGGMAAPSNARATIN